MNIDEKKQRLQEVEREKEKILDEQYEEEYGGTPTDKYEDAEDQYKYSREGYLDQLFDEEIKLKEEINEYYYYENFKKLRKNSEYINYNIEKIFSDECAKEDLLNRTNKAKQLAKYICNDSMNNSFNIGVIGEWGTGKSTFLKMIEENINKDKENKNENIYILEYDASTYSEQNQIWASIAKILFEKFEKEKMFSHLRYSFQKLLGDWKQVVSKIGIAIVVFIFIISFNNMSDWIRCKNDLLGNISFYVSSITGIILAVTQIIIPVIKEALDISIPLSKKILSGFQFPSFVEILGTREKVTDELNTLFKAWLPKEEQKIVIFVDELDRCTEKGICEFFQAIQLFFQTKKIIFVFAIEFSHLKKALAKNLKISGEEIEKGVIRYLDKYVSMVIPMQNYNILYEDLIENLIEQVNKNGNVIIEKQEIMQIKESFQCIPNTYLTPRKVKKMINVFVLSKNYCLNCDKDSRINYSELFSWIILKYLKPEVTEYIKSLYNRKKEYSLLKDMVESTQYEKILKEKMDDINYMEIIENYSMHDIFRYEQLSEEFCILAW